MESGSEIRCIIEDTKGGLCCEPGEYDKVEENIRWFIDNAGSEELKAMGARSRENLEKNLTRNVSVQNSFGIYLFHQQLIYPCIMLLNGKVHPAVQVIVCFIAAICGATVITEFLRKFKVTKVMFGI